MNIRQSSNLGPRAEEWDPSLTFSIEVGTAVSGKDPESQGPYDSRHFRVGRGAHEGWCREDCHVLSHSLRDDQGQAGFVFFEYRTDFVMVLLETLCSLCGKPGYVEEGD